MHQKIILPKKENGKIEQDLGKFSPHLLNSRRCLCLFSGAWRVAAALMSIILLHTYLIELLNHT